MAFFAPTVRMTIAFLIVASCSTTWSGTTVFGAGEDGKYAPIKYESEKAEAGKCQRGFSDFSLAFNVGGPTPTNNDPQASSKQRTYGTLEEFQISRATWAIAGLTAILAFIAAIQLVMFFRQLAQTKRSIRDAEAATRLENRAYLGPKNIEGWFGDDQTFKPHEFGQSFYASVEIVNFGKTQALDVVFIWDIRFDKFGPGAEFPLETAGDATSRAVVYPGQSYWGRDRKFWVRPEERSMLVEETHAVYVYGTVTYRDVFGAHHETQFRSAKVRELDGVDLIACAEGNSAD